MARRLHSARVMRRALAATVLVAGAGSVQAAAQQSSPPPVPLAVGTVAPDFTVPSATAKGAAGPFTLGKYRGKTVVLAFFFKARTKG